MQVNNIEKKNDLKLQLVEVKLQDNSNINSKIFSMINMEKNQIYIFPSIDTYTYEFICNLTWIAQKSEFALKKLAKIIFQDDIFS